MNIISRFIYLLDDDARHEAWLILALMLVGAVLEGIGVGLILPFIAIINQPQLIHENHILRWIYEACGQPSYQHFLLWTCLTLLIAYVLKNTFLALMYYLDFRYIYQRYAALSRRLFNAYLRAPYTFHLQRNSSELLKNIMTESSQIFCQILVPLFTIAIEGSVSLGLMFILFIAEPVAAMAALGLLIIFSGVFYRRTRNHLATLGLRQQENNRRMFQWVSQGLGGAKETKVLGREDFFLDAFNLNSESFADSVSFYQASMQFPRLIIETIAVMGILLIVVVMLEQRRDPQQVLPVLALFATASFRLMPSLTRIINAVQTIRFYAPSIDVVYNDISALEKEKNLLKIEGTRKDQAHKKPFSKSIVLENIYYRYPDTEEYALSDVSFSIPQGSSVAITGPSGAGKTTLADIFLGLLYPQQGEILIDGVNIYENLSQWQSRIGYVSQGTYLSDDTIRCNIAFGLTDSEIDEKRIQVVLEMSQLKEFVDALPLKEKTIVGERGTRLSGGQRQRLGIARALYHNPEILVMDEATSSLDDATEGEVNRAIERLSGDKTLIIIAHRASTVAKCLLRFQVKDGKVIQTNSVGVG